MRELQIIQYNCGGANGSKARPVFDALDPERHSILAVQEPMIGNDRSTYCPMGYRLAISRGGNPRTCFMVSKAIDEAQWQVKYYGPYISSISITTIDHGRLTIINVYSPGRPGGNPQIIGWQELQQAMQEAQNEEIIVLGDFNCHHPKWGGMQAATQPQAEHLLQELTRHGLQLCTPPGEATWERGSRSSVIDLTFMTIGTSERLEYCGTIRDWSLTRDHYPIAIRISVAPEPQAKSRGFNLNNLNEEALRESIDKAEWARAEQPITALQEAISQALETLCKRKYPSRYSKPAWSAHTQRLIQLTRAARRRHTQQQSHSTRIAYQLVSNSMRKAVQRDSRQRWRLFLQEIGNEKEGEKALWMASKWSTQRAGKPPEERRLPALRAQEIHPTTDCNRTKAAILAARFFPVTGQANLDDITHEETETHDEDWPRPEITAMRVKQVIGRLPRNKAAGPDDIPNEVLKALAQLDQASPNLFCTQLAQAISSILAGGTLPSSCKESITVALRKEGKRDYSLPSSYRPIALENTLAKVIEKIIAEDITSYAEKKNLLPWNQMGGRKGRSTITAIQLLQGSVETAWKANPTYVVSALSLDISGAFDNVSHERLINILRRKNFPKWIIRLVTSFLTARSTRIAFLGHIGERIQTQTGIPQGSPLSPILFLLFISELLETFQNVENDTIGLGFVDDTTLVTWGPTARENCARLEQAHQKCESWADRHGAKFAPDKYQLMHFTRKRRHCQADLSSTVRIGSASAELQRKSMKILGVWVDPKLSWAPQRLKAVTKGYLQLAAMERITAAVWGPSMARSKLLYTATVRPAVTYGAQAWSNGNAGGKQATGALNGLKTMQNRGLRRILGAYKRTPVALLERETGILPIDLHMDDLTRQHAASQAGTQVAQRMQVAMDQVWNAAHTQLGHTQLGPRPPTTAEAAIAASQEIHRRLASRQGLSSRQRPSTRATNRAATRQEIQNRWEKQARGKRQAAWQGRWNWKPASIHGGLTKAESTALFLMRSEVIGLNAWLQKIGVPGQSARCPCGHPAQTVPHVLLYCSDIDRGGLLVRAGTRDLQELLGKKQAAQETARWMVRSGTMKQFTVAREIAQSDTTRWTTIYNPEIASRHDHRHESV
jgi:hypothetical protein